jgi:glycosyltransferase involved in cell wall biosynthesis
MSISVIIPHMPMPAEGRFPSTDAMLDRCVDSLKGQYDELIIVVNDGIGFGPAVNRGFRAAHGDHLCLVGNDCVLTSGSLRDLASGNRVMAPRINGPDPHMNPRAVYCQPRWAYELVGGYDERFEIGFWEDDDLMMRWRLAGVEWEVQPSVVFHHWEDGGLTMKQLDERGNFERNRVRFNDKWGTTR